MKQFIRIFSVILCLLLLAACGAKTPAATTAAPAATKPAPAPVPTEPPLPEGIRNIIIIIGDGTGEAQLQAGELAEGTTYVFRDWDHTLSNTDSLHSDGTEGKLTDSAAGGTALATGQLTSNGKVAQPYNSTEQLKTILDYAKEYGKSTGVVSTDNMYGATPASFSGHAVSREDTLTILYSQLESGIDLLCSDFDEAAANLKSNIEGAGYTYCDLFSRVDKTKDAEKVYWQFDMAGSDAINKLEKVVPHALAFLDRNRSGFVLMIEQAHVDKYCHNNQIDGAAACSNSLNNTVAAILEWLGDRDDTAIIITADHETGGLSVSPEDIYENRYLSPAGKVLYYQFTSTGHTQTPVPVYWYGFSPDMTGYYLDEEQTIIKNTSVFQMMLELLKNPEQTP